MSKTVMRLCEPRDVPELLRLHAAQLIRDKVRYPFPDLFDDEGRQAENIPLALVVAEDDKPIGAVIFEDKGVEMMIVGCSPRVTAVLQREKEAVLYTLKEMGYRWIRSLVTRKVLDRLRKPLRAVGFRRDDTRFASFFKEI